MLLNKEEYLKDPNHCPLCGAKTIWMESIEMAHPQLAFRVGHCYLCGNTWKELFPLTTIEK